MEDKLREIGLENYEAKALAILFKEKLSLENLSKKAKIPFGKVYSVVKGLKEKGFVKENNSRPKLVYVENVSEVIKNLIRKNEEKTIGIFDELRQIGSSLDKQMKQKTSFFEIGTSVEENKNIQMRTFIEAEKEVLQIINIHHKPKSNRASNTIWENEIIKAVKKGVVFKSIYPKETDLPKLLKKLNRDYPDKFIVKRYDTDFIRCDIVDGAKVLIKLVQQDPLQFGGILFIENERLAENLKKIFEEMWNS